MPNHLPTSSRYFFIVALLTFFSTFALAQDIIIEIEDARIDKPVSNEPASGFMHIINFSENKKVVLKGASTRMANSVQLQPNNPIEIDSGAAINLVHDEQYIIIKELNIPLKEGMIVPVILHFEHGDEKIDMVVVKPGTHLHKDEDGSTVQHENH